MVGVRVYFDVEERAGPRGSRNLNFQQRVGVGPPLGGPYFTLVNDLNIRLNDDICASHSPSEPIQEVRELI